MYKRKENTNQKKYGFYVFSFSLINYLASVSTEKLFFIEIANQDAFFTSHEKYPRNFIIKYLILLKIIAASWLETIFIRDLSYYR